MIKTTHDEKLAALTAAIETVNVQTFEDLDAQGARLAANMILRYGDKICTTPQGFIEAITRTHTLTIGWLIAEGYVTLTEKALATDEERAEVKAMHDAGAVSRVDLPTQTRTDGAYL